MPGRRTRGAAVDYRALDGPDSDDDFNVPTPPTKRPRAQRASERAAEFADGAGPSHGRVSLDDKLFKKQLRIALQKSKSDCQATSDTSSQEHSIESADTLPVSQDETPMSPRTGFLPADTASQDSADQDEWAAGGESSSDSGESGEDSDYSDDEFKPQPKKATKKPVKTKATKSAKPKAKPMASSKSATSPRLPPANSLATAGVPSQLSDPPVLQAVSPVRKSPASSPAVGSPPPLSRPVLKAVNSAVSSARTGSTARKVAGSAVTKVARSAVTSPGISPVAPALSSGRSTPKWKPPARISDGGAPEKRLMSPSSGGGLRLGLSRNVRRKPLHPSAKPVT